MCHITRTLQCQLSTSTSCSVQSSIIMYRLSHESKILLIGGRRHLFRFTALPSYHLIAQNHTALNPVQLTGTQPKGNQNSRFFAGINGSDRPAGLRCNRYFVSLTVPRSEEHSSELQSRGHLV